MRLRLHIKFALWLLLTGILPLVIMGGYSMVRVQQTVQESTRQTYFSLADQIAREVHRIIGNGVTSVYFLAENLALTTPSPDAARYAEELIKTQRFHPIIKDLTLLDRNGNTTASALYSFRGDLASTRWYQQASIGRRVFTGVHSVLYPFDIVMTTAAPVYDGQTGMISGVLVGQLSMEPLWQIFSDTDIGEDGKILLLDDQGIIVASPDRDEILSLAPAEVLGMLKKNGSGDGHIHRDNRRELMVSVALPGKKGGITNDWHIVIIQPVNRAYTATATVWRGLMLAAAVSLAGVAVVSTILSRHISSRIRPLTEATSKLGKGEFPLQLAHLGQDEIGELGEAFVHASEELAKTSEKVRTYQDRLEDLVESRTRELQATNTQLQQQMEERIRMEEERKKLEEQFRQAQKLEAVGTLAGGIAHDFNNILQIISGQVQLLLLKKDPSAPDVAALSEINQVVSRASELVRRLLTFSRKMETAPQRLNLNTMVTSTVKLLRRTIPKMIIIENVLDQQLRDVMADYNQMEQVLMNLTSNASDAMPNGGVLKIGTENCLVDSDHSKFLEIEPGAYVVLSVEDTGIGMDESVKKHIFEPFFTSKGVGKGTGLGLSTVYGIVQDHGGQINCYSELGKGTRFTIYLPVASGEMTEDVKPAKEDGTAVLGGLETILVVDDEAIVREIAEDMLSRFGYKVYLCQNGEEALEMYSRRGDEIDLVITDIGMPGMGGEKLVGKLRDLDPAVKIIIASGYGDPCLSMNDSSVLAMIAFVQKPYQLKKMLKTIRQTLNGT